MTVPRDTRERFGYPRRASLLRAEELRVFGKPEMTDLSARLRIRPTIPKNVCSNGALWQTNAGIKI